ncbi:hypothetical protein FGIG_05148 [Fasciola gigantica]|uniref:Uncharacterized protein n=1 Tax=Fasciola gigantica TaxID=46835 RepID=A0A504YID4_FASGI|nr:hypothetical protein FGIG_05148 [Fasciola gigantica]
MQPSVSFQIQEWLCEKKEHLDEVDHTMSISHVTLEEKAAYRTFVGKKYAQLRQLESELDMHTQRIQQVFQDVVNAIVQRPKLSDRLKIKLSEITSDWDELRRRMRDRITCMVQMHRAIIFQDGCLRLDLWLKTFAEKLSLVEAMNLADTVELSCTPTVNGPTVAEPDGTALLTPCNSLHAVNVQLQTVNTQLEESKAKEKLLDELKTRIMDISAIGLLEF